VTDSNQPGTDAWASTSFEGCREEQLREWAKLPFAKKVEWLEEAQKLAMAFEKARLTSRPMFPQNGQSSNVK
jgi:hypothetical protein